VTNCTAVCPRQTENAEDHDGPADEQHPVTVGYRQRNREVNRRRGKHNEARDQHHGEGADPRRHQRNQSKADEGNNRRKHQADKRDCERDGQAQRLAHQSRAHQYLSDTDGKHPQQRSGPRNPRDQR
jgi:chromatin remodeling complex protein RSC6